MAKTRKVLHFVDYGREYSVIKVYGESNPYRIYHHYRDFDSNGYPHNHKKLMAKYANLASCFYWFFQRNIGC